jgi:hypothetical protein
VASAVRWLTLVVAVATIVVANAHARAESGGKCPPCPAAPAEPQVAARPWGASVEAGAGVGFFFATHGTVNIGVSRQLWQRLEVEAAFRVAAAPELLGLAAACKAGVLLHLGRRVDLLLFWRLGYIHFRAQLPTTTLGVHTLLVAVGAEVKLQLAPAWELRVAPIAGTGYWNELWGFVMEPTIGLAYRF